MSLAGCTRSTSMAPQLVMDHTGDTRHHFDVEDIEALSKAEARFRMLTGVGFTAAVRDAAGKATVTRTFDPTAEETLFFRGLLAAEGVLMIIQRLLSRSRNLLR